MDIPISNLFRRCCRDQIASLKPRLWLTILLTALILSILPLGGASAVAAAQERLAPIDYHQHLFSPAAAALIRRTRAGEPRQFELPPAISDLLRRRIAAWDDPKKLAQLYTQNALGAGDVSVVGRDKVAELIYGRFGSSYELSPIDFASDENVASMLATYSRTQDGGRTDLGQAFLTFERVAGQWLIASESMTFPAPARIEPVNADHLIKYLDDANIRKAVVLSVAYLFDSPFMTSKPDVDALRAENDWTAQQVAKYPKRLVAFCGVNPITENAIPEIERCSSALHMKGVKIHLANSGVDFTNASHIIKLQHLFKRADELRMPIVVHLWNGPEFGQRDAQIFLDKVLGEAPHIPVQIAHMAGAGPGWSDDALQVFVAAIKAKDRRVRNVYFDVATVANRQNHEQLALLAKRIREIGVKHVLYGSDGSIGNPPPKEEWATFRGTVPLTDQEFARIRDNIEPWVR